MALSLQATQMRSFGVRSARPSQALQVRCGEYSALPIEARTLGELSF